ncbi:MAG: cation:proton antiporter [Segniliparus sp.]|uniref:cation:proton antiporter n=1 Tax=Segniliparus sp. TaxID=2804064 RepID=UPI003F2B0919
MSFGALCLVAVIGLAGPLLASIPKARVPVVIGELLVGVLVGRSGFAVLDTDDSTFAFLADIGFGLVMFVAGTHVPVRNAEMRSALPKALLRCVPVGVAAALLGAGLAAWFHTGHAAVYAVLMASSSAALVLPVVDSLRLTGPAVLATTAQVAIADTACIIALPLVIDLRHAGRAALGALAVAGCAVVVFLLMRAADRSGWLDRMHDYSKARKLALELRINLAILFFLAALAVRGHVSIMLAGFALGLVIAAIGEPRRLARQLFGITEGFFGPLFFVWLGASLHVRELLQHPSLVLLGLALGGGALAAHLTGRLFGQPIPLAVLAAAQLGVPVAAAKVGDQMGLLVPGEGSALIFGALITVAATTIAGGFAAKQQPPEPAAANG